MKKTYTGSCHCQAVRFEVDLDLSQGTIRCNCTYCVKTRNWCAIVKAEDFRLLAGEEALQPYRKSEVADLVFCRHCGVRSFHRGYLEELGGALASIRLACLDDVDPAELISAPVRYTDGRADNWWSEPAETRHL